MSGILVTDAAGKPVHMADHKKVIKLLHKDKAVVVVQDGDKEYTSDTVSLPKPLVVQLKGYVQLRRLPKKRIVRRVLFARDGWKCAYCDKDITERTGTIDHVKPKIAFKREGRPPSDAHTWDNVVASCKACNRKKGGRLPYECGMHPNVTPKMPNFVQTIWAGKSFHPIQAEYIVMYHSKELDMDDLIISGQ